MAWKLGSIGLARHKKCIGLGNMEWGLAQTVTSMPATLHLVSTAMRHMRGVWAIVHTAVTTSASHRVCILRGKHSDDLFFECPVGHAPFSLPLRVIFVVLENRPHLSPFGPFRATPWHFHHHFHPFRTKMFVYAARVHSDTVYCFWTVFLCCWVAYEWTTGDVITFSSTCSEFQHQAKVFNIATPPQNGGKIQSEIVHTRARVNQERLLPYAQDHRKSTWLPLGKGLAANGPSFEV